MVSAGTIGTGTITVSGTTAGKVNIALCPRTNLCAIKKIIVTNLTAGGTAPSSWVTELFEQPLASASTTGGQYSVVKSSSLTISGTTSVLFKEEFDSDEAPWCYANTTTPGTVSVWVTPTGADGTTAYTFSVRIYAEEIERVPYV